MRSQFAFCDKTILGLFTVSITTLVLFLLRADISWLARLIGLLSPLSYLKNISYFSFALAIVLFVKKYRFYKGLRYGVATFKLTKKLEKMLFEALLTEERGMWYILPAVPKIQIFLSDDRLYGQVYISNSIRLHKRLDTSDITSALGKYIVETHYLSSDGNYRIYEIAHISTFKKLVFTDFQEFYDYADKRNDYQLFINDGLFVDLQHTLLVGQTGTGKTYGLYSLILQMMIKRVKYNLFLADPKGSSLFVAGSLMRLPDERNSVEIEEIIDTLEKFNQALNKRELDMRGKLKRKLDSDYRDFDLEPYVFIFDEYAAFQAAMANEPKAMRDKVNSLLTNIVLKGRQLGFFLFVVMQKSDADIIKTALRDNLPLKIVLGNAEKTTYTTAFGPGADIPDRLFEIGEGVFTEPKIAPKPRYCSFPTLKFDIGYQFEKLRWL